MGVESAPRLDPAHGQAAVSPAQSARKTASRSFYIGLVANLWITSTLIFAFTRLLALVGAYPSVVRLTEAEPFRNKGWLAELALMWDSAWYVTIARDGYSWQPGVEGGTNVAFAPLYPMLVRGLSEALRILTFGWDWGNAQYGSYIAAGLLISNLSFLAALALLIKLLTPRLGSRGAAAVALGVAALPLSFFFSAIYTEAPFLLVTLGAFAAARSEHKHKWLFAGLLGAVASLLKFAGVLLLPVLLVEYLWQRGMRPARIRPQVMWLGLVPLGMAAYMLFLAYRFGNPFAFLDSQQRGWNHQASFFLATYWESLSRLWQSVTGAVAPQSDPVLYYGNGSRLYLVLDLAMPLLLVAGGLAARKKLVPSEWVWLVLGLVYPLSTNITFSMARYMLPLWPGLVWLGMLRGRWRLLGAVWLAGSLWLLVRCAGIYAGARWIG